VAGENCSGDRGSQPTTAVSTTAHAITLTIWPLNNIRITPNSIARWPRPTASIGVPIGQRQVPEVVNPVVSPTRWPGCGNVAGGRD
jgi:hypothetical protein